MLRVLEGAKVRKKMNVRQLLANSLILLFPWIFSILANFFPWIISFFVLSLSGTNCNNCNRPVFFLCGLSVVAICFEAAVRVYLGGNSELPRSYQRGAIE